MKTSSNKPTAIILGKRYQLIEPLGMGGMGAIFRAQDLLTRNTVALKQVTVPTDQIMHAGRAGAASYDLALAREFKLLATIRYPHIISVYDFGFGRQGQPYYTMEYLDGGQTILESSKDLAPEEKVDLTLQMLEALVYLHRRGILHRDLKPTNALVLDRRLRLLDFGISVTTDRSVEHLTQTTSGTLAYLAPEIFQGAGYSRASDLYAVGLIAFQLFSGEFPYNESNLAAMLFEIVSKPVDASAYGVDDHLAPVINKLLAKTREVRYTDAVEVINDLARAMALPGPSETIEIRESFLQAARFVGREKELAQLSGKLESAINGRGKVVLIGGESGVGKSRLLDELRVRALVKGVLVLEGQAISNGRSPYQLWAEVFRSLALFADLSDDEAENLKPFLPDIDRLLDREVAGEPSSTGLEADGQLVGTISRLLSRLDQPAMILLEDLQWAGNASIQLLSELAPGLAEQAVLIAGTYRDDEPLPGLKGMMDVTFLPLGRLAEVEIIELCVSMLGRAGSDPALVSLLLEETEGNAFFLVEAVRALAEGAGRLDDVGKMALPDSLIVGGIRAILNRRLDRVPAGARPLMKLASVTGRQLDLGLLHALEPEVDLEPWLAAVAEVSVIEAHGESWRFAHDKLREEIKDSLTHEEHHALHRRVAEGLEVVYPDAADQAAALAYHWAVAGDREKERHYAVLAGRQAVRKDVSEEAIAFFQRALQLLSNEAESPERDRRELAVLMDLGPQLTVARGFGAPEVETNYARAQELALRVGMANDLFRTIWGQWSHHNQVLGFDKARGFLEQLFRLAEQSGDESLILAALHAGWASEFTRGDHILVANYIERGLRIYDFDRNNDHTQLYSHDPGMCAHMHGSINLWLMGYPDRAFHMAVAGQAMAGKMKAGDQRYSDISVAFVAYLRGEYQDALELGRAVKMRAEEAGHQLTEAYALLAMGVAHTGLGQHAQGLATAREALQAAVGMYADSWRTFFLAGFLEACLAAGNVEEGLQTIHIELAEHELSGQRVFESEARRLYGELILASGSDKTEKAEREFQLAFDIAHQQSARSLQLRAMMSLARLWQKQGNIPRARERLLELYRWFSEGIDTDDLVTARQLLDNLQ